MDIDIKSREIISKTIKKCPYSRYHIAKKMSELTGHEITKASLDSWTAKSKNKHRFPAIYVSALCIATNDSKPLEFLAKKAGLVILLKKDALRADVQKLKEQRSKINKEIKKRESQIEVLEEV